MLISAQPYRYLFVDDALFLHQACILVFLNLAESRGRGKKKLDRFVAILCYAYPPSVYSKGAGVQEKGRADAGSRFRTEIIRFAFNHTSTLFLSPLVCLFPTVEEF